MEFIREGKVGLMEFKRVGKVGLMEFKRGWLGRFNGL